MAKDVIHISEAEAANDFATLLAHVRAGAEVVIENDARPVAVLRSAEAEEGPPAPVGAAMAIGRRPTPMSLRFRTVPSTGYGCFLLAAPAGAAPSIPIAVTTRLMRGKRESAP
ncbi:MAG: type II toxin-antitoxin system Phd/YefM family antitoxin [Candidatus Acidiferrales bacterium]